MSTSASIRKIKIPGLTPGALPRKEPRADPTTKTTTAKTGDDVLIDIASFLVRKYKILQKWDRSRVDLFEQLKTKSESKCVLELFRLCKKSVRKKTTSDGVIGNEKDMKVRKKTTTIFRGLQKKRNSSKKKRTHVDDDKQENTITEAAQRSA